MFDEHLGTPAGSPSSDLSGDQPTLQKSDWIDFLKRELKAPCLQLVTHYLETTNGHKKKSLASCLAEFRAKYRRTFKVIIVIDFLFKMAYVGIFLVVAVRGLGVEGEIKATFDYIGRAILYLRG